MKFNNLELDKEGRPLRKPECGNPDCSNPGWLLVGTKFYCAQCYTKFHKAQQQQLMDIMEKI